MANLIELKRCSDCKALLPLTEFNKNLSKKDGLGTECRGCCALYKRAYRKANREKINLANKIYDAKHPETKKASAKKYRENNKEKRLIYNRQHRLLNAERYKRNAKEYRLKNKERLIAYQHESNIKNSQELSRSYVARLISSSIAGIVAGIKVSDIGIDLIEAKRTHLMIQRLIKERSA